MGAAAAAATSEPGARCAAARLARLHGVYRPRRPRASPLYRLIERHCSKLSAVYDDRFAHRYGEWRPVITRVVDKFLACGIPDHGFARVRCGACAHEYLLAFSCKCRYCCPSCHAKRLALWCRWLEDTLLAPVPHRQVVLTIPQRLRVYCLYRRSLLGDMARVAARTITAAIRATTGERDLSVGIVASIQTHGSLANWHPHLHLVVTDGGFRPDGTFGSWPVHDVARFTEAFRRAVLRLFVRRELFDPDQARSMLAWPHSGSHVHDSVWAPADDRPFALRLARYCARNPVALERLEYQSDSGRVTYHSDQPDGPTAGSETLDALEFLARLVTHIPDTGQVLQRYSGWYASRTRGIRPQHSGAGGEDPRPVVVIAPAALSHQEARRRWAELLRRIFEVDPLTGPRCGAPMRIISSITDQRVIARILAHLWNRKAERAAQPVGRLRGARQRPPGPRNDSRPRSGLRSDRVAELGGAQACPHPWRDRARRSRATLRPAAAAHHTGSVPGPVPRFCARTPLAAARHSAYTLPGAIQIPIPITPGRFSHTL